MTDDDERRRALADALEKRVHAYRSTFLRGDTGVLPYAEVVLADLADACFAFRSTTARDANGRVDPIATAENEGMRKVWLRVNEALRLDDRAWRSMLAVLRQPEDNIP